MGAIAGIINFNNPKTLIKKFYEKLNHRIINPVYYFDNEFSFISDKKSPIVEIENHLIIFDGELYNENQIKLDNKINSDSVCETVLKLFLNFGIDGIKNLNGKFVFCIYNKISKRTHLFRDQIGEKVVYYSINSNKLSFSSEVKALLENKEIKREVNIGALEKYLTFSYVPGSETMIKNVFELLPSQYLIFDNGNVRLYEYWNLIPETELLIKKENYFSEDKFILELRKILDISIKNRLPNNNEEIGCFLSGGIDSSLVSALVKKYSGKQINTYSIYFGKKYPNELYYSNKVAEHIKSNHNIVEIKPKNFLENLYHIIYCLDDPIGDPITVPNFLLAERAKKDVNYIFNGEGGDPCFGGPKNIPMMLSQAYSTDNNKNNLETYYLKSYRKCFSILNFLLSENVQSALKNEYLPMTKFVNSYLTNDLKTLLDKLMFLNIRLKGAHHILVKVDKMMSANKINVKSSLFSKDIAKYSLEIPSKLKLNGKVEKYLLKKAVENILPLEVVYREKKGMMVPVKYWFQKDMKKFAKKVLSEKNIKEKGYFNPEYVKKLLNYDLQFQHRDNTGLKIWMLLTFEIWHQLFIENELKI